MNADEYRHILSQIEKLEAELERHKEKNDEVFNRLWEFQRDTTDSLKQLRDRQFINIYTLEDHGKRLGVLERVKQEADTARETTKQLLSPLRLLLMAVIPAMVIQILIRILFP